MPLILNTGYYIRSSQVEVVSCFNKRMLKVIPVGHQRDASSNTEGGVTFPTVGLISSIARPALLMSHDEGRSPVGKCPRSAEVAVSSAGVPYAGVSDPSASGNHQAAYY